MARRRDTAHASVRRGDRPAGEPSAPPDAAQPEAQIQPPPSPEPEAEVQPPPQAEGEAEVGFPGGPSDLSLLTEYRHHEAAFVWRGEGRADLRAISHGKKMIDFQPTTSLRACLERIRLRNALFCCHSVVDKGLIAAFVERWHQETCSFHLPIGEMSITLDDVACLTNLPIDGQFFSPARLVRSDAITVIETEMLLSHDEAIKETNVARGPSVTFGKLKTLCEQWIQTEAALVASGQEVVPEGQFRMSEKAYIVRLLGCLIRLDKSGDAVPASYLALVQTEATASAYAWGTLLLASLYEQLGDASLHKCKQISGCLSVLQAWIYWHFPSLGGFSTVDEWTTDLPLISRYEPVRGSGKIDVYRSMLDNLTPRQVVWTPYEAFRQHHPLTDRALYTGFIRVGSSVYQLRPERCLRQFGFVQTVPPHPPRAVSVVICDEMWDEWELHTVDPLLETRVHADYPGACVPEYMQWLLRVSHPWVLEPCYLDHAARFRPIDLPDLVAGESSEDWARVAGLAERLLRDSTPGTSSFDISRAIISIASHHTEDDAVVRRVRPRID